MRHAFDFIGVVWALNVYVPYTVISKTHPMNQVSASSSQTPLVPIYRPRGMDGLVVHGRDRTIYRVHAQRASYHCPTRAPHQDENRGRGLEEV
ncbi:hypothetical protein Y032_0032g2511 [Ancylostoma ceylanicum]|uniref:Uncharacterized protein n=1 Tax=Ancylostoma ceylanicum TaxID=53326 RepID=A0A016UN44_9BILA|nr:hypothetical protein Y032_0032g2511 [Ancylostoma ceylanicum]